MKSGCKKKKQVSAYFILLLCQHFKSSATIVWAGMEITAAVDNKAAGSILTQDNAEIQQGSQSWCCQLRVSLSSHICDHAHILSPQALELHRIAALRQKNQSFTADRLTFEANSEIIPSDAWFAIWLMCQLISPDGDKDQPDLNLRNALPAADHKAVQMWWESRARPLSEGEQVLLRQPAIVELPLSPDLPLIFFISVCSSSGHTWWAWSCGWRKSPVWLERTAAWASGRCRRLHLLYVHMYEQHVVKPQNALPVSVITTFSSIPAPRALLLTFHSSPFRRTSIRLSPRGWAGWWRLLRRSWAACRCCRRCGGRWCARVAFSRCCWGPWRQTQTWRDCSPQLFDDLAEGEGGKIRI